MAVGNDDVPWTPYSFRKYAQQQDIEYKDMGHLQRVCDELSESNGIVSHEKVFEIEKRFWD